MKIYDVSRLPSSITLGWDGENNWRPIAFDCSALLTGQDDPDLLSAAETLITERIKEE